jgi:hypothetical protein
MILRFDDVCANTHFETVEKIIEMAKRSAGTVEAWLAVNLFCETGGEEKGAVYPLHWNARSDLTRFYEMDKLWRQEDIYPLDAKVVSHGLVHVDHRLLGRQAQEMSIIVSCSILGTDVFVPPFHKYNTDTERICKAQGIELIKYEEGWRCAQYEPYDSKREKWYLHTHSMNEKEFGRWIEKKSRY